MTALSLLADLQCRYDGPIPQAELDAARGINTALLAAQGNARFYTDLARRQIATIRARRASGTAYPALGADLRLYLEERRHWRRVVRELTP